MNPIVESEGAHSSVWLMIIDDKIWGYVPSTDSVKSAFKFLADKFIGDIKTANPTWNVEAVQLTEEKMQIKCIQPGYLFNSEWVAHTMIASPVKEYREPNDSQTPILMPFPEKDNVAEIAVDKVVTEGEASEQPKTAPLVEAVIKGVEEIVQGAVEGAVEIVKEQCTPEAIEAKIAELVPTVAEMIVEEGKSKRSKKRSRQNSPVPVETLIQQAVEIPVVPAIETAASIVQLDRPTHVDAPKNLKSSWERKRGGGTVAHISKYPQNRTLKKK